jgi:hypothetical protein
MSTLFTPDSLASGTPEAERHTDRFYAFLSDRNYLPFATYISLLSQVMCCCRH